MSSLKDTELLDRLKRLEDKCFNRRAKKRPRVVRPLSSSSESENEEYSGPTISPSLRDEPSTHSRWHLENFTEPAERNLNLESSSERQSEIVVLIDQDVDSDDEILFCLGKDPKNTSAVEHALHPELAARWNIWLSEGIPEESKKELIGKYSVKGNCKLSSPKLNAELETHLAESAKRRDVHFVDTQNLIGKAMAALGSAITILFKNKEEGVDRLQLLETLCDTGKLMAEVHHNQSLARRAFISPGLERNIKPILERNKIDDFLFGSNLSQKVDEAKAIQKNSLLFINNKKNPQQRISKNLNWKSPPVRRNNQSRDSQVGFKTQTYKNNASFPYPSRTKTMPYPKSNHVRYQVEKRTHRQYRR
ncbi:uncharacterized protein LOC116164387 [Photinus pyralis]|uniref:uncharacterized protein LOC116164387 n=1 Tax=Photinus pyralis TaxID=7054 RepID=UPI001267343B|nr:uncharacterized protein LOC116164387 [Photinus pyralis]